MSETHKPMQRNINQIYCRRYLPNYGYAAANIYLHVTEKYFKGFKSDTYLGTVGNSQTHIRAVFDYFMQNL